MLKIFKEGTTPIGSKAKQTNPDLIERGIFVEKELPEYCVEYEKVISRAMGGIGWSIFKFVKGSAYYAKEGN